MTQRQQTCIRTVLFALMLLAIIVGGWWIALWIASVIAVLAAIWLTPPLSTRIANADRQTKIRLALVALIFTAVLQLALFVGTWVLVHLLRAVLA